MHLQLTCSKTNDLHSFLYADAEAIDLTIDLTSNSLHFKILVTAPSSSSKVFSSSMDDRPISLASSFCDFHFQKLFTSYSQSIPQIQLH